MTRFCAVMNKGVMSGNNVSHAKNKTRRRFLPNLQHTSFLSEILGRSVSLRLSARGIRTVELKGGIDTYLMNIKTTHLTGDLLQIKKMIVSKQKI